MGLGWKFRVPSHTPKLSPLSGGVGMPSKETETPAGTLPLPPDKVVHLLLQGWAGTGLRLRFRESPPCVCLWELQPPRVRALQELSFKNLSGALAGGEEGAAVTGRGTLGLSRVPPVELSALPMGSP